MDVLRHVNRSSNERMEKPVPYFMLSLTCAARVASAVGHFFLGAGFCRYVRNTITDITMTPIVRTPPNGLLSSPT